MEIDWTNPDAHISVYFTVNEALYLPTWKRMANDTDGLTDEIKANLIGIFAKMDAARDILGAIIVHVAYRPEAYNKLIGGAPNSAHKYGNAVDFHAANHSINDAKDILIKDNFLEKENMRLEAGTPSWIHLDVNPVTPGHNRIFNP